MPTGHLAAPCFHPLARKDTPSAMSTREKRRSLHARLRAPGLVISGLSRPLVSLTRGRAKEYVPAAMMNQVRISLNKESPLQPTDGHSG
jgi:hypothetical protein